MLPRMMASDEDASARIAELVNRFGNSSRTVDSFQSLSGDKPRDFQPRHCGTKSQNGTRCPCMTFGASLNEVVIVQ